MTTFGSEWIRDEVLLAARILLVVLFLIFGWGKLTDYFWDGRLHGPDRRARTACRRSRGDRRRAFRFHCGRPWRLDASAGPVAGTLYAGNRVFWASLLDHDGRRPIREYDQFLQKHKHHR